MMRALVIGFGSIGKRHARVLRDQLGMSVAVVSAHECHEYPSFRFIDECHDLSEYDYFVISSETKKHREQLLFIDGSSNITEKKILVEKPLFCDGIMLPKLSGRNTVWTGYNLRFHPVIQKTRELISNTHILSVHCTVGEYLPWWRPDGDYRTCYSAKCELGGGVLLDLSHEIDYLQWLFGNFSHAVSFMHKISGLEINTQDIAMALVRTSRGCIINVAMDYLSMIPVRKMLIHTDNYSIDADLEKNYVTLSGPDHNNREWVFVTERDDTYREMHKAILYSEGLNCCSYDEGVGVMRSIEIIKEKNVKDVWYAA
jgi:predicted dehydrogenase